MRGARGSHSRRMRFAPVDDCTRAPGPRIDRRACDARAGRLSAGRRGARRRDPHTCDQGDERCEPCTAARRCGRRGEGDDLRGRLRSQAVADSGLESHFLRRDVERCERECARRRAGFCARHRPRRGAMRAHRIARQGCRGECECRRGARAGGGDRQARAAESQRRGCGLQPHCISAERHPSASTPAAPSCGSARCSERPLDRTRCRDPLRAR